MMNLQRYSQIGQLVVAAATLLPSSSMYCIDVLITIPVLLGSMVLYFYLLFLQLVVAVEFEIRMAKLRVVELKRTTQNN